MTDTKICRLISALLNHAENCGMLDPADRIYAANLLCAELHITAFEDLVSDEEKDLKLHEILDAICEYAAANNIINEGKNKNITQRITLLKIAPIVFFNILVIQTLIFYKKRKIK